MEPAETAIEMGVCRISPGWMTAHAEFGAESFGYWWARYIALCPCRRTKKFAQYK